MTQNHVCNGHCGKTCGCTHYDGDDCPAPAAEPTKEITLHIDPFGGRWAECDEYKCSKWEHRVAVWRSCRCGVGGKYLPPLPGDERRRLAGERIEAESASAEHGGERPKMDATHDLHSGAPFHHFVPPAPAAEKIQTGKEDRRESGTIAGEASQAPVKSLSTPTIPPVAAEPTKPMDDDFSRGYRRGWIECLEMWKLDCSDGHRQRLRRRFK